MLTWGNNPGVVLCNKHIADKQYVQTPVPTEICNKQQVPLMLQHLYHHTDMWQKQMLPFNKVRGSNDVSTPLQDYADVETKGAFLSSKGHQRCSSTSTYTDVENKGVFL